MKIFNFLKEKNLLIPALGVFLIISCLVFFMLFNFGFDGFQNRRVIASEPVEEVSQVDSLILKNLSEVLVGRKAEHSHKPTQEDQFLFGFLQGNYKAFKVQDAVQSIKLKDGQPKLIYRSLDDKRQLVHEFKRVYLGHNEGLADPVENRFMASEQLSYSIVRDSVVTGRLDLRFTNDHELIEIKVFRL